MAAPAKYTEVMSVIKRRIREGDYLLDNIPGERKIAEETGVSYMTARRAVQELLDEEVLIRQPSGSLDVHPEFTKRNKPAEVVLLCPAYPSSYLTQLRCSSPTSPRSAASACGRRSSSIGTRRPWSKPSSRRRARSSFPTAPRFRRGLIEPFHDEQGRDPRRRLHARRPAVDSLVFRCAASNVCSTISTSWAIATSTASTRRTAIRKSIAASTFGSAGCSGAACAGRFARRSGAGVHRSNDRRLSTDVAASRRQANRRPRPSSAPRARRRSARFAPAGSATSASARTFRFAPSTSNRPPSFSAHRSPGSTRPILSDVLGQCFDWFASRRWMARPGTAGTEGFDSL